MEEDAYHYVKKCIPYQKHGVKIIVPSQDLQLFITPQLFSYWGINLIGKIHPTSSNGHKFIINTTKYFTKWVEDIPLTFIAGKQISNFILNYLIYRYGISKVIITDNGICLKN